MSDEAPKNASYWKRQARRLDEENAKLRAELDALKKQEPYCWRTVCRIPRREPFKVDSYENEMNNHKPEGLK